MMSSDSLTIDSDVTLPVFILQVVSGGGANSIKVLVEDGEEYSSGGTRVGGRGGRMQHLSKYICQVQLKMFFFKILRFL